MPIVVDFAVTAPTSWPHLYVSFFNGTCTAHLLAFAQGHGVDAHGGFSGTGSYTTLSGGGGKLTLKLSSVALEAERTIAGEALKSLEAWHDVHSTDDAFARVAQWLLAGGLRWFAGTARRVRSDYTPQQLIEHRTGRLIRWHEIQRALVLDEPGALLRWWRGEPHPGQRWDAERGVWDPIDVFHCGDGPEQIHMLIEDVQQVVTALHDTAEIVADAGPGCCVLRGTFVRSGPAPAETMTLEALSQPLNSTTRAFCVNKYVLCRWREPSTRSSRISTHRLLPLHTSSGTRTSPRQRLVLIRSVGCGIR